MRLIIFALLAAATPALITPVHAAPGGVIATLPLGDFVCELPGNAEGPVGLRMPASDFTVLNASSYRTSSGQGTYLLTGDRLVMTAGPLRGSQYRAISPKFLRRLDGNSQDTRLRCILRMANNDHGKAKPR
ncbi:MAG: hypothetical protein RLZZ136_1525 [Pseudomonadota bacterium]